MYFSFEGVCLTHVILTPGACGREGLSCGSLRRFRRIRWIRWIRWIRGWIPNLWFRSKRSSLLRLPEINMLKMGAIPGKDYHTGPTAPILSMLISCMSQRLRYGLTAPRDYAYISPKSHILAEEFIPKSYFGWRIHPKSYFGSEIHPKVIFGL